MRHVAQTEGNGDTIKIVVRERQIFCVAHGRRKQNAFVQQAVAPYPQHRIINVGEPDLARRTRLASKGARHITRATGDIQDFHAGPDRGAANGKRLPDTVQTGGHQIIHDVVALSDRMKNLCDLAGFFRLGDRLIAKMRVFFGHGTHRANF